MMPNYALSKELIEEISDTLPKLKHSVTLDQVAEWVLQFEEKDRLQAIELIYFLQYLTCAELQEYFNDLIEKIVSEVPSDRQLIFVPLGLKGKSGSLMSYFIRKTPAYKKIEARADFYFELRGKEIDKPAVLVAFDDFIGTGTTAYEYLTLTEQFKDEPGPSLVEWRKNNPQIDRACIMAVFVMQQGEEKLRRELPEFKLYANPIQSELLASPSSFSIRYEPSIIKALVEKYGATLKSRGNKSLPPMGYGECGALIAFAYGCPNNTLPIIWHNHNWKALYPRIESDRIEYAENLKNNVKYWYGLINRLKIDIDVIGDKTMPISSSPKDLYGTLAYLKLKSESYENPMIAQTLGISQVQLTNIIEHGSRTGFIQQDGRVSARGMKLLHSVTKVARKTQSINLDKNNFKIMHPEEYIPKPKSPGSKESG